MPAKGHGSSTVPAPPSTGEELPPAWGATGPGEQVLPPASSGIQDHVGLVGGPF